MQVRALGFSLIAAISLQGCATAQNSLYGPKRPFQGGKLGYITSCPNSSPRKLSFLEDRFIKEACESAKDSSVDKEAKEMLVASFSLTNARCTDYFAQKAGTQTKANILRSSVAPLLTLLTGVLSIVNFKNDINGNKRKDWEIGLGLVSTASLAALTVFEENFLFSSENINDVRELTKQAMDLYKIEILKLTDHTFDTSVDYALEYHMICTPGKIKGLVKQAIKEKKITVVDRATGAAATPAAAVPALAGAPAVPAAVPLKAGASLEPR